MIYHERVLETFDYDPVTGWVINKISRPRAIAGERAGTINGRGYRQICYGGAIYLEHRFIWFYVHGEWPKDEIDHKDGDRQNNAFDNLREATCSQNKMNRPLETGTSGLRGVSPNKSATGWRARVWVDGQEVSLGEYATKEEAHKAY